MTSINTQCLIVGGGPAGMIAGLLLARAGVEVLVAEQYPDFLRDFRGDTVHPSTLGLIDELGYIDEFLELPHHKISTISIADAQGEAVFADFSRLPGKFPYVVFMPQWDLLNFLADKAKKYEDFTLLQSTKATELIVEDNHVTGARLETERGIQEVRANLVLACDGRHSTLRESAQLPIAVHEARTEVLWFRISKHANETTAFVHQGVGFTLICIDRGTYWQIAYVIPQDSFERIEAQGLQQIRTDVASVLAVLGDRFAEEITTWNDLKLLQVRVDRLRKWYRPGLLCIGDAAHAMSPAGGVGINLAIQDAVATSRILASTLAANRQPSTQDLAKIQRRRQWPVRIIQAVQTRILSKLYPDNKRDQTNRPLFARMVQRLPILQGLIARIIGIGLRPEHISTTT